MSSSKFATLSSIKPFSREEFALELEKFEDKFDSVSELGSIDMTSWIRNNSSCLLVLLESNPTYYNEMHNAIRMASPGSVFRVAERILNDTL